MTSFVMRTRLSLSAQRAACANQLFLLENNIQPLGRSLVGGSDIGIIIEASIILIFVDRNC